MSARRRRWQTWSAGAWALALVLAACGGGARVEGSSPADGGPPAPPVDAMVPEAGPPEVDAGAVPDAEPVDAGAPDAVAPDAAPVDAGSVDAEASDAEPADAEPVDATPPDAGPPAPPDLAVFPEASLALDEGGQAALLVSLDPPPPAPLTVTLQVSPTGALALDRATLTFTPTDCAPRVVLVSSPPDADAQDADATLTVAAPGVMPVTRAVHVTDRDRPRAVVTPWAVSLAEGGSAHLTVRLDRAPSGPVVLTASTASPLGASPGQLSFGPGTWDQPQEILLTAARDDDAAPALAALTLTAPGLPAVTVPVAVADQDTLALSVSPATLVLAEDQVATVQVRLTARPLADVVVSVSTAAPGLAAVTPGTLTFTPAGWPAPQAVTLTAARDGDVLDAAPVVRLTAAGLAPAELSALVRDAPVCGDGVAQGAEPCDGVDLRGGSCRALGFSGGTLACNSSCGLELQACATGPDLCGDGVVSGAEACDGAADAACPGRCSAHCACPSMAATGLLEVHVIDVGQGDAILVISPDGFTMLVDSATEPAAPAVLSYLAARGVSLDYTVVSHMDADHVGGMDELLLAHPEVVAAFDHGGWVGTAEYVEYDRAAGARRVGVSAGDTLDLGPGLQVDVLHAHTGAADDNDNSVVLRLRHGAIRVLLGGDCEAGCEAQLDPGPIEVYKVHHHGSRTSSSEPFLRRMAPYTGLISAGIGNVYGHPHPDVVARLLSHDMRLYGTWDRGSLRVVSDGSAYTVAGEPVCTLGELHPCGTSTVGACQLGNQACDGAMWGACQGAVDAAPEDCGNGADDDCDGAVDLQDADCARPATTAVLAQVFYDTPGNDAVEEAVALYNPTAQPILLDGYSLADAQGAWSFPSGVVVAAHRYLCLARDAAGFAALFGRAPDLAGLGLSLGNGGDALTLRAPGAVPLDSVAWGTQSPAWPLSAPTGAALVRRDPGLDSDTAGDWRVEDPAVMRCAGP
jgi:beta-lactamase superfamily II metal-dependent hydrolase